MYTEKVTLEQALMLEKEHPNLKAFYPEFAYSVKVDTLDKFDIPEIYKDLNHCLLISRPDYAQYVIGNKPVPEGRDEVLLAKHTEFLDGKHIEFTECFRPQGFPDYDLEYNHSCNPDWTYAHVKVNATATETDFKVGDRVKWGNIEAEIVGTLRENNKVVISYEYYTLHADWEFSNSVVLPETLTLIPNE